MRSKCRVRPKIVRNRFVNRRIRSTAWNWGCAIRDLELMRTKFNLFKNPQFVSPTKTNAQNIVNKFLIALNGSSKQL